jgi:hypothetical protein
MKFWELDSVMRSAGWFGTPGRGIIRSVARKRDEWRRFAEWSGQFGDLVARQDREKLDHELPNAFARAVLHRAHLRFYLSEDGILRSHPRHGYVENLSAHAAFDRFGGAALEDALEKGSVKVA